MKQHAPEPTKHLDQFDFRNARPDVTRSAMGNARPEVLLQRALPETGNPGMRIAQRQMIADIIENSPRTSALRQSTDIANGAPHPLAWHRATDPLIQKKKISATDAKAALLERAPVWAGYPYVIIETWDDDPPSNCHGFTATGKSGAEMGGEELLAQLPEGDVLIFVDDGMIAHSGRWNGSVLRHLLIGIGILESQIGNQPMGYLDRFILPSQAEALQAYLAPHLAAEALASEIYEMRVKIGYGINKGIAGADDLYNKLNELQDDPELATRDEMLADCRAFIAANHNLTPPEDDHAEDD